jgi:ABC-type dipeptide/oligopeptide/nickel transport system ATPase component
MAMALDPAIVIADEPTSSLDAAVRHEMITWLEQMRDAHDLGVVTRLSTVWR